MKSNSKNIFISSIILIIITGFSFWKFQDVYSPLKSFTNHGDGIGTLSIFSSYHNYIEKNGNISLLHDKWQFEGIGVDPQTFEQSLFVRAEQFILHSFLSVDDSYDTFLILSYIATFIFSIFLFRAWEIRWLLAISGAFIIANLDNFYYRAGGHMLLAAYFSIPLFIGMIFYAARNPFWINFAFLSASFVLTINVNEYYGYYSGIAGLFTLFVLIAFNYFDCKSNLFYNKFRKLIISFSAAATVFLVLMIISYPMIIGSALGIVSIEPGASGIPKNSYNDFIIYNPTRPLFIFKSSLPIINNITNYSFFKSNIGEFKTFRIGFIPFLVNITGFIVCIYGAIQRKKTSQKLLVFSVSILLPCFVLFLFSMPINHPLSLAIISYKLGAIFRVGARAYMVIDIYMLLLCFLYLDYFMKWLQGRFKTDKLFNHPTTTILTQIASTLIIVFIVIIIHYDASGLKGINRYKGVPLENTSIYSIIAEKENGWLIEYPIAQHFPECNYGYWYHQHVHGMPVLNFRYPNYDNDWFEEKYRKLDEDKIEHMHRAGVRYICVTQGNLLFFKEPVSHETLKALSHSKFYKEVANNSKQLIYEANITPDFDSIDIREFAYDRQDIILSFTNGWSGQEVNRRWSTAMSAQIKLNAKKDTDCRIILMFDSIGARDLTVNYSGKNILTTHLPSPSAHKFTIKLLKGDNYLNFLTNKEPRLPGNGDPRKLSFALLNYRFEEYN